MAYCTKNSHVNHDRNRKFEEEYLTVKLIKLCDNDGFKYGLIRHLS